MKQITLITFLLINLFSSVTGQNTKVDSTFKKNEIKINALYLLVPVLEISYERILNEESSIGSRVGTGFTNSMQYAFEFMPYYRLFFLGKQPATGLFAEINANAFVTKQEFYPYNNSGYFTPTYTNKFNLGMGLAVGGKFLTRNKKNVLEIYGGAGRNFLSDGSYSAYPAIGISFGKRF